MATATIVQKAVYVAGAKLFLAFVKPVNTWLYNAVKRWPRSTVKKVLTPEAAEHYYKVECGNPYAPDPLFSVFDCYTPPECLQWALENGGPLAVGMAADCDDASLLYLKMLEDSPLVSDLQLVTIIDSGIRGCHVIAARGRYQGRVFVLDTNGLAYLPDDTEETLCTHFTALYSRQGYNYIAAVPTRYPF